MSDQIPQITPDDELSVEELEQAAGGIGDAEAEALNTNCGGNCGCTVEP